MTSVGGPRLRLQGNPNPPTADCVPAYRGTPSPLQERTDIPATHFGFSGFGSACASIRSPVLPNLRVSRKKSRVSRPRSSGKSFHFPRRTFSRSPTGCPHRRFAASATPVFCDRRPFLCRRADFFCRRSTFLCRRRPHGERPQHPPIRAYRRPDSPIPPPESAASSRPTLPPQPDSFATTSRPAFDHSQIGRGPQPDFGLVSSAHTANFCRSFLPPSGVYRPLSLVILPDSLWHTSRSALP